MGYSRRSSLASKRKGTSRGRSQSRGKRRGKTLAGWQAFFRRNRKLPKAERLRTPELILQYWGSVEAYRAKSRAASARATDD